jgi:hypothetical protein
MIFSQKIVSYFIDRCRDRGVVNWGPFAGAPATEDSLAHCWMRLLGVYEFYLHPAVEAAILANPPVVLDVGASSGYYSIGMANRLPGSRHFAFEMQESERESLARTAAKINTTINLMGALHNGGFGGNCQDRTPGVSGDGLRRRGEGVARRSSASPSQELDDSVGGSRLACTGGWGGNL